MPERNSIGGPEQESITTTRTKAADIGGLLAFRVSIWRCGVGRGIGPRPA